MFGEIFRLKLLVSGHHQQVKAGFLGIAEKEVFTDINTEKGVYPVAVFDGSGHFVIRPDKGNLKRFQQIIDGHFFRKTSLSVRFCGIQMFVNVEFTHSNPFLSFYFPSQRPLAPQGRIRPLEVTGSPSSWESVLPSKGLRAVESM